MEYIPFSVGGTLNNICTLSSCTCSSTVVEKEFPLAENTGRPQSATTHMAPSKDHVHHRAQFGSANYFIYKKINA
jgi:hypothetical protein